ncbi:hypothetical protein C5167_034353 [Papaver somniferum]|uniref:Uncharacterized protein n=1 Tax=Papaver somniferum TaxID=3469 RepID=A0A4Y7KE83_PAPSO|nr:hypothetical protein C5167_034353 [Papaver somniferum]
MPGLARASRCDPELEHVIFGDIDEQEANVDELISTWRWRVIPNTETVRLKAPGIRYLTPIFQG